MPVINSDVALRLFMIFSVLPLMWGVEELGDNLLANLELFGASKLDFSWFVRGRYKKPANL